MCDPVTIGLALGSFALDRMNASKVERDQERARRAEAIRQAGMQDDARRRVETTTQEFQPAAREARFDREQADLEDRLAAPLREGDVLGAAVGRLPGGRVTGDYLTEVAREERDALDRTLEIARLMSRIDARGRQRFGENKALVRSAEDLVGIGNDARGSYAASQLERDEASQGSPVLGALSGIMGAAAGAGVGMPSAGSVPGAPAPGSPVATIYGPPGRPRRVSVPPLR